MASLRLSLLAQMWRAEPRCFQFLHKALGRSVGNCCRLPQLVSCDSAVAAAAVRLPQWVCCESAVAVADGSGWSAAVKVRYLILIVLLFLPYLEEPPPESVFTEVQITRALVIKGSSYI